MSKPAHSNIPHYADEVTLRLVVESAPSALIMVDVRGKIALINRQAEKLFGYTRDELVGKSMDLLVPERYRTRHPGLRNGYLAAPSERAMGAGRDLFGLRKDGSEVPVEIGLTPIDTPDGMAVLAAVIDISERKRLEQERSDSERRYADLVEQAVDGILVRRSDGPIVFVNEALCELLGYGRDELLAMSVTDLIDPADRESFQQAQTLKPLQTLRFERLMCHKNGRSVPVEISARRLRNGDIQNIIHDITARRHAEQTLRDSEAHFRLVVESAPNALVMVDAQGTMTLVNAQAEKLFGYRREELLGRPVEMLVPRRFRGGHQGLRRSFTAAPSARAMGAGRDLYGVRADGSEVPIEIGLTPVENSEGLSVLASIIDISERRRAERELRESEQLFRSLVEATTQAVWVAEGDGTVLSMSDTFEQLTGIPFVPDFSARWTEAIHPDDRNSAWNAWSRAVEGTDVFAAEYRLRMRDGNYRYFEARAVPIVGQDGSVHRWIGTCTDIQDRKDREEYLRVLPRRLLDAQEAERRRIARELHDEVGQALTASQIKLRDLQASAGAGEEKFAGEAAEISAIVSGLLQQVRQMSLDLRPSVLDDLGLVSAMRWFLRERVAKNGVEAEFDVHPELSRFGTAVETTVFRVFQSALTNVLRHAEAKAVNVSLRLDDRHLVLEIRDDGKGFDVAAARRRARQGGSVGLLGMEEWVRLTGGSMSLHSGSGRGTTVTITVPVDTQADSSKEGEPS